MLNISNIEYYIPDNLINNEKLGQLNPEWDMEAIKKWTGVSNRYYASKNQTALDLAYQAAKLFFSNSNMVPEKIDGLIFCTHSNDYILPPNSTILHGLLNLPENVFAFDFNHACSGFIYGLALANSLMKSNTAKNILLINSDTYSNYVSDKDRSTKVLFSDAASLVFLNESTKGKGLIDIECSTSGANSKTIIIPSGGTRNPRTNKSSVIKEDKNGNYRSDENLFMDGFSVYSFVNSKIPKQINLILSRNQLKIEDIDLFVFHQANKMVLESITKILKIDHGKVFMNIDKIGNTVSASIPIALRDAKTEGKIKNGDLVLCSGFGAGLSWGTCIFQY
jgi:3-oxoacyl-[acyl-carrier-protein] synthase-3